MIFHTQLSIDECKLRLESAVDTERFAFSSSGYAGSKYILGKFHDTSFRLQMRRNYQNLYASYLYGQFIAQDSGTLIYGKFKMNLFARVFMIIMCSICATFTIFPFVVPTNDVAGRVVAFFIFGSVSIVVIGGMYFSRMIGRREQSTIIMFLKNTLNIIDMRENDEK